MKPLRQVLADSHVAAVAIVVFLLWATADGLWVLWALLSRAAAFLFTAIAILDIPYINLTLERMAWLSVLAFLYSGLLSLLAARLLSRWAYGVGPLCALSAYRARLESRNHA